MGAAVGAAKEAKGLSSQLEDVSSAARVLEKAATSNIVSWQRVRSRRRGNRASGSCALLQPSPFPREITHAKGLLSFLKSLP